MLGSSTTPVRRIAKVQFSLWGSALVRRHSALNEPGDSKVGVNIVEIEDRGIPRKGGINDMRMGTVSNGLICGQCGQDMERCPTHIGHVELHKPVFHVLLLDHLKDVLNCVCTHCAKLRVKDKPEELQRLLELREPARVRFSRIKKLSGAKQCLRENSGCGSPYYKFSVVKSAGDGTILFRGKLDRKGKEEDSGHPEEMNLDAERVFSILKNVSDEDHRLLGFDYRPEDLVIKTFLVSAKAIRPSNRGDYLASGSVVEDKLTQRQLDIVKNNKRIGQYIEREATLAEEAKDMPLFWSILQLHVALYMDSESIVSTKSDARSSNKVEGIKQRIDGKDGRIRGNLMGKRTEYTARCVVTSEPNVGIDEVGVPLFAAMALTFPEVVTQANYERLLRAVRNGRSKYPGANYVIRGKSGSKIDLRYQQQLRLQYGDTVERHLVNGDLTLFNRQPSLHKASLMAHRIHVLPSLKFNSFRLNVSATTPYNADFDGDEMNMFVPRSVQTRVELEYLAAIPHQIISVRHSEPLIANKQDTVLALYLMTHLPLRYDQETFVQIVVGVDPPKPFRFRWPAADGYSGAEIISAILPAELNMRVPAGDGELFIEGGELRSGVLTGGVVKKLIIPTLYHNFGPQVTTQFINNTQKLAVKWLYHHGFTVGYADNVVRPALREKIRLQTEMKKAEVDALITKMENNPQMMDAAAFEQSLLTTLSSFLGTVSSQLMEHIDPMNNYFVMINSGSKGNKLNMGKINGVFGQNVLHNQRIPKNFNNRTLPHFAQHDDSAAARGFIENSFMDGQSAVEMFAGARSGRDGCITTAKGTADTGYAGRRMIKALEDIVIAYDNTLRNSRGFCYQLLFGGSGLDQARQQAVKLRLIRENDAALRARLCLSTAELQAAAKGLGRPVAQLEVWNESQFDMVRGLRDRLRRVQRSYSGNLMTLEEVYFFPFNIAQHLADVTLLRGRKFRPDLTPEAWEAGIARVLSFETLNTLYLRRSPNRLAVEDHDQMKFLFLAGLFDRLSYRECVAVHRLTLAEFERVIDTIVRRYKRTFYPPGEQIGVQTAQSLAEPNTQMTLSSFHGAGSLNLGMQGLPRVLEVLESRKDIKTPIMYLYFDESVSTDPIRANVVGSYVTQIMLHELVEEVQIIYDRSLSVHAADGVDNPFVAVGGGAADLEKLPWLFRMVLNKEQMLEKSVSMLDIKRELVAYMERLANVPRSGKRDKETLADVLELVVLSTYDNSDSLVVHLRAAVNNATGAKLLDFYELLMQPDKGFKIKGVDGISGIQYVNRGVVSFAEDGSVVEDKQYIATTTGSNLLDVRQIQHLNFNRSYTNDIVEFYRLYGVEAARTLLLNQLRQLFSQEKVNVHHFELLVDKMTYFGQLTPVNRHGLNKPDVDIMARASFEEHSKQFVAAAVYNEVDGNRAVSSRVMTGHAVRGGTGLPQIFLDEQLVMNSEYFDHQPDQDFADFQLSDLVRSFA